MTTTPHRRQSHSHFVIVALAGATAIAAAAAAIPVLVAPANAGAPASTTSSHQRLDREDHRVVHHDARRDVLLFDVKSETSTPAPRDRATDVTTTVVDHRVDRLVVHTGVRQLSRSGYRLLISEIRTSDGRLYELDVDYSVRPIDTRVTLTRSASGAEVRCSNASWSIKRSTNRVDASVPNSCLGNPRWVRVGIALVSAPRNLETSRADDSRSRGHIGDRHLKLGPRQHRA